MEIDSTGGTVMNETLSLILLVIVYIALVRFVFPKLGIG